MDLCDVPLLKHIKKSIRIYKKSNAILNSGNNILAVFKSGNDEIDYMFYYYLFKIFSTIKDFTGLFARENKFIMTEYQFTVKRVGNNLSSKNIFNKIRPTFSGNWKVRRMNKKSVQIL